MVHFPEGTTDVVDKNNENKENFNKDEDKESADFETALKATSFGKFNYVLLAILIPCSWAQCFESYSMAYIVPVAQCDLNLSLDGKGRLNSVSYAGMILSGFFWGYISDRFGRRNIMLYGYLAHFAFMLLAALSQNFAMLMTAKFFGGLIVNGPTSALISLLSEFHISKYRARIHLLRGIVVTASTLILPLLGWLIFPSEIEFTVLGLVIHSWNVFMLVISLFPLSSVLVMSFLPESPRFLISAGRYEEALQVFRTIYRVNTGNPEDTFPYKKLIEDTPDKLKAIKVETSPSDKQGAKTALRKAFEGIIPLCVPPYVYRLIFACINICLTLMSLNTLRAWQPQLLQAINDYKHANNGTSGSMCDMLVMMVPKKNAAPTNCTVNLNNSSVYINSIIISCSQLLAFAIAGTVVQWLGKKSLIVITGVIAGTCSIAIYFAQNADLLVALFSIFIAVTALSYNVGQTTTIEMFPTSVRAASLGLYMVSSRIGTVFGNLIFPTLLNSGCMPPFFFISLTIFGGSLVAIFFPNTENKSLK